MTIVLIIALCNFPGGLDNHKRCEYIEIPHWTMSACVRDATARAIETRAGTKARDVAFMCVPLLAV